MQGLYIKTVGRRSIIFNRVGYSLLSLGGMIFLFRQDWSTALMLLAIGLAFDPFDAQVNWKNRPLWKRAWPVVHLGLLLVLVVLSIFIKN